MLLCERFIDQESTVIVITDWTCSTDDEAVHAGLHFDSIFVSLVVICFSFGVLVI